MKNKIIVFIPTHSIQSSPQNHNFYALNVLFPFLAIIMRGQRMVREWSEYSLIVLPTGSARVPRYFFLAKLQKHARKKNSLKFRESIISIIIFFPVSDFIELLH